MHRLLLLVVALCACESAYAPSDPVLEAVLPESWRVGRSPRVDILGDHLSIKVANNLKEGEHARTNAHFRAWLGELELSEVMWVDNHQLSARATAELPLGAHDLTVETPDGRTALLENAVTTTVVDPEHSGATSIADGETLVDVPLTNSTTPDHSVLFFNTTNDLANQPRNAHVSGQLVDADTVRFERDSSGPVNVTVRFSVIEHPDWRVLRGGFPRIQSNQIVPLGDTVDLGRTFLLATWRQTGGSFNDNDWLRFRFANTSTLEVEANFHDDNPFVEWQAVEMTVASGAEVSTADVSFSGDSVEAQLPSAVDRNRSLLFFTYNASGGTVRENAMSGQLITDRTIEFRRAADGGTANLTYYVLTWPALTVQHGKTTFAPGETTYAVSLPCSANHSSAFSLLSGFGRQGWSEHTGDRIGNAWFTTELFDDDCTLEIHRGASESAGEAAWSVAWID